MLIFLLASGFPLLRAVADFVCTQPHFFLKKNLLSYIAVSAFSSVQANLTLP